jgi:hypothetical protein
MDSEAKRIIALKEELRRDLEAIERVERLMAFKNGSLAVPDGRQGVLSISVADGVGVNDESLLQEEEEGAVASLKGTIDYIINSDLAVRWTNQKMLTRLRADGFKLRAKKPIYSIGQAMQKLADAGSIKLVRKGAGNQPNIYRGKQKDQQAGSEAPSAEKQGGDVESTQTSIQ